MTSSSEMNIPVSPNISDEPAIPLDSMTIASHDGSDGFEFDVEINEHAPRAQQPKKIKIQLKAHQLACLYKAMLMEQKGSVSYDIKSASQYSNITAYDRITSKNVKDKVTLNSNIGIIGDIVGYGKTLTALSIIAECNINKIHINRCMSVSYCNPRNYSYLSYTTNNGNVLDNSDIIKSTLIIVPRGPVYVQWQKSLQEQTSLKFLAIENLTHIKKYLPASTCDQKTVVDFFNSYDAILIKNTTLDILLNYYEMPSLNSSTTPQTVLVRIPYIKRWQRIMIDEAHDILNKIPLMYYEYLWLISGTYENLVYSSRSYNNLLYSMRDCINYDTINLILVKCTKEFVRNSFQIPIPNEHNYLCKLPAQFGVIKNLISSVILEKINANDIVGAIRDLGGKSDTEDNIIKLVSKELQRDLLNKEKEKEYTASLDIPEDNKATKIKNIENEINAIQTKLQYLTERISELNTKMCPICMYDMEHPMVLECTHAYCASCIMKWLTNNMNCPECRHKIDVNKMIAIVKDKISNTPQQTILSKEDTLLKIIQDNPNGKFLVFSKYDSGFVNIISMLMNKNISCSELKGNTSHMMNVLEKFKSGHIRVILLNTHFAGSGIDISYATDVIIYHSMGLAKYQAIGRAQRVGRKDTLNIHHLCYEHEMLSS